MSTILVDTKTVKVLDNVARGIATLTHGEAMTGRISPDHIVKAITDVPANTSRQAVLQLFNCTLDLTGADDPSKQRYSFRFEELGIGRVITE